MRIYNRGCPNSRYRNRLSVSISAVRVIFCSCKGGDVIAYALTAAELKQLKRLQDKQRDLAKKEAAFWRQVDERRAEVLQHFRELDAKKKAAENVPSPANNPQS